MTERPLESWKSGGIWQVAKPQIRNVVRSKWLVSYVAFFVIATEGLLRFTGADVRTLLSLANVVLFIVPMVTIIYGTIYLYSSSSMNSLLLSLANVVLFIVPMVTIIYGTIYLYSSREFIELLLAQPLRRRTVFAGVYLGLAIPLTSAIVAGVTLPFLIHGISAESRAPLATMLAGGVALTLAFTGIAFWLALKFEDRLTGLGAGLAIWLFLGLVYDGVTLLLVALYSDHSLEKALLGAALVNPIDLVRIALLLQFDVSALMGYTGAVFSRFFSGALGFIVIAASLSVWIAGTVGAGFMAFEKKDF